MQETLDRIHVEYAVDAVLSDMDEFSEWLTSECYQQDAVTSEHEMRALSRIAVAPVPVLLSAALKCADRLDKEGLLTVMGVLTRRYIERCDKRITLIATEAAQEVSA